MKRTSNLRQVWVAGILLALGINPTPAGPPLLTDDPDTPGPNNWEINVAFTGEKRAHDWSFETPLLDLNYGLGEHIQLKYEVPWVIADPAGAGARSGLGNSLAGVKWRFLDQDKFGLDVSTYPQVEFNSMRSSVRRGFAEDGTSYLLPIEAARKFGPVTLFGEWGYVWNQKQPDEWFYGIAGEYEISEKFSLLAELHGTADRHFHEHELVCNLGFHWQFSKNAALIGSVGRGLHTGSEDRADFLSYLGLQFTF